MFIQLIAVISCLLFTGASIYVSVVEHPARLSCGTVLAATVFGPSYRRASKMQASLALIAAIAGVITWWQSGLLLWLVAAVLIFLVIPFTLMVMMPINRLLSSTELDRAAESTGKLLHEWGRLHRVRSLLGSLASFVFLWALV